MSTPAITLRQQRCSNHPQREASARCPECSLYYCRECITEHDDRVLCASCLAKLAVKRDTFSSTWAWVPRLTLACVALAVIYIFFLLFGDMLLSVPAKFHAAGGW